MSKVINWLDFVRFIKDEDMWSRWSMQYDPQREVYFEANLMLVNEKKTGVNFDFDKVNNIQVMSKDESTISWEHDGESLWYFYTKFLQGKRV